jgi:FkbM family methyltransferase
MKKTLKIIYESIPFKLQIYNLLRKFIRLPHHLHQYLYFTGVFKTYINDRYFLMKNYGYQFHVENEYFWGGISNGWEKVSTKIWLALSKNTDSILDIGANTGCFSLISKTVNPTTQIHCFEPLPGVLEKLRLNISLNNYDINIHPYALSNFNGNAKVYPTSLDHVYSVTVNKNLFENAQVHEQVIEVRKLADVIRENNITKIDLMKIDVETHEVEVLEGMGEYLSKFQPDMLIEVQTDEIASSIEKMIEGMGYIYFNIDEEHGVRKVDRLVKSDWLNYLICKKETANYLAKENLI